MLATVQKTNCLNHEECERKREKWERLQAKFLSKGEKNLENFLTNKKKGIAHLKVDTHFFKRCLERFISEHDVKNVLNYGWVIERNKTGKGSSVVLLGYSGKNYRPIHVVFDIINDYLWVAVTAYNPESNYWKWNDTFDKRICFCNPTTH